MEAGIESSDIKAFLALTVGLIFTVVVDLL